MNKKFSKIKKACLLVSIRRSRSMKKGFSLIEVLVSLLILSFGLTAIAVLMLNNIKGLQTSKNQIIASMLAQEGVELVRNFKDNSGLNSGLNKNQNSTNCNYATATDLTSHTCDSLIADYSYPLNDNAYPNKINPATEKDQLVLDSNGFYKQNKNSGTETKFYREINFSIEGGPYKVSPEISDRVLRVLVFVTWNNQGFTVAAGLSPVNSTNCNVANQCVYTESSMPDPII